MIKKTPLFTKIIKKLKIKFEDLPSLTSFNIYLTSGIIGIILFLLLNFFDIILNQNTNTTLFFTYIIWRKQSIAYIGLAIGFLTKVKQLSKKMRTIYSLFTIWFILFHLCKPFFLSYEKYYLYSPIINLFEEFFFCIILFLFNKLSSLPTSIILMKGLRLVAYIEFRLDFQYSMFLGIWFPFLVKNMEYFLLFIFLIFKFKKRDKNKANLQKKDQKTTKQKNIKKNLSEILISDIFE
jgi:hypothetical protein